jgi:hypothetical protein
MMNFLKAGNKLYIAITSHFFSDWGRQQGTREDEADWKHAPSVPHFSNMK